jgi:glycosyltransferase involved in cell wall biosynthesis
MITGQDFIIISSLDWDFLWQGPHEIATRLARAGNRVLYIENTGVRAPKWSDACRIGRRVKSWAQAATSSGLHQIEANLFVCSPLVMPPFSPGWPEKLNGRIFLRTIARVVRRLEMRDPVLWTFLPTDTANAIIRLLRTPRGITLYYCVADFAQLVTKLSEFLESEAKLIEMSDLLLAQGPELAACWGQAAERVRIVPYGVNLTLFSQGTNAPASVVAENRHRTQAPLRDLQRPIVGYVGGLHRHVDIDLLEQMGRLRANWSWVYVGPLETSAAKLTRLNNVHLLGHRPHTDLPAYIEQFDACIVPYLRNAYTNTVWPTKINEYLAMGKPVIATPIPSVCKFNREHNIISIANALSENFLQAIERALASPYDPAAIERRRQVAALSDWEARLETMSGWIESALQAKRVG